MATVKLVKTFEMIDLGSLTYLYTDGIFYSTTAPLFGNGGLAKINTGSYLHNLCEIYANDVVLLNPTNDNRFYVTNTQVLPVLRIVDTRFTSPSALKSALSGVKAIFELATPVEIPLSDTEQITAFVGSNNVWSDTGDSEVQYYESFAEYISKHQEDPETRTLASSPSLTKAAASLEDVQEHEKTEDTEEIKTEGEGDNER